MSVRVVLFFLLSTLFVQSPIALSSEIDSFTNRSYVLNKLNDDLDRINSKINYYINLGLKKANKKSKKCKQKHVQKYVRRYLGGHFRLITSGLGKMKENNLYRWLKYDGPISRHYTKVPDSIYKDFKGIHSPSLKIVSIFHDTMGAMLKVDDLIIGSDKFSHFFNRGLKYYKHYTGKSKETKKISSQDRRKHYMLKAGRESEASLWGSKSTGIASYGDLAANFQGMRFWNEMFGTTADPVTGEEILEPYVSCSGGRWRLNRYVDVRKYINTAWDEAYNCSKFRNSDMANSVRTRIGNLKNSDDNTHCPLDLEKLRTTKIDFGEFYDEVVNETPYISLGQ